MSDYTPTEDEVETAFHEFASQLESESPGTYEHAPEFTDWKQAMYGFQRWRNQFRTAAKVEALREAADGFDYEAWNTTYAAMQEDPDANIDRVGVPVDWLRARADTLDPS